LSAGRRAVTPEWCLSTVGVVRGVHGSTLFVTGVDDIGAAPRDRRSRVDVGVGGQGISTGATRMTVVRAATWNGRSASAAWWDRAVTSHQISWPPYRQEAVVGVCRSGSRTRVRTASEQLAVEVDGDPEAPVGG
jgi:hypothetical protein